MRNEKPRTKHEYYCDNKERLNAKNKIYQEENKEDISASRGEIVTCECGCNSTKSMLKRHKKTAKHLKLMQENK